MCIDTLCTIKRPVKRVAIMAKKMISLEIPDNLREALRIRAFQEHVSISEMIRRVLTEQLQLETRLDLSKEHSENETRIKD